LLLWASPSSAQIRLSMDDGHVTLSAANTTMSQILAEWARVGQAKVINGDRVTGSIVSLELSDVSEEEVLEQIILRSVSAYVLAPRSTPLRNVSRYDRILILPTTSAPVRAAAPALAPPAPAPSQLPRPPFGPPPTRDDDQGIGTVNEAAPPVARPPTFNAPQPQPTAAPAPPAIAPTNTVTAPPGVSVPGMVAPAPAQPGQGGQPAGTTTPRR
jgi:hypothetical protein